MGKIFVSFATRNLKEAQVLLDWIKSIRREKIFMSADQELGLQAGDGWENRIFEEIEACHTFVTLISSEWHKSQWCPAELAFARRFGKKIIPVCLRGAPVPQHALDAQAFEWRTGKAEDLEPLREALSSSRISPYRFKWPADRSPFPGLSSFQESDAGVYFGMDDTIEKYVETLDFFRTSAKSKVLIIAGASGSGKSSLLRAGIVPHLRASDTGWRFLGPFIPGNSAVDEFTRALASSISAAGAGLREAEVQSIVDDRNPASFATRLASAFRTTAAKRPAFLIAVDQAEELFDPARRAANQSFLAKLEAWLQMCPEVFAVMTMRSESLRHFQASSLAARIDHDVKSLRSFPAHRIRELVEGPAERAGIRVVGDLVDQIIDDATSTEVLPVVAFTLSRMLSQSASKELSIKDYNAVGRIAGAIEGQVQEVMAWMDKTVRPEDLSAELAGLKHAFIPFLLRWDAQVKVVTRRRAELDTLPPSSINLIQKLIDVRLLTTGVDFAGCRTVTVTHEAVLSHWPQLRQWAEDESENLKQVDAFLSAVADWRQAVDASKPADECEGYCYYRNQRLRRMQDLLRVSEGYRRFVGPHGEAFLAECVRIAAVEMDRFDPPKAKGVEHSPKDAPDNSASLIATIIAEADTPAADRQQAVRAEAVARMALDAHPGPFAVWDNRRRLTHWNSEFGRVFNLDKSVLRAGASYDVVMLEVAQFVRLERPLGEDATARELFLQSDKWIRLVDRPTSTDGLITVGLDISATKTQEATLQRSERRLRSFVQELERTKGQSMELAEKYAEAKARAERASQAKGSFLAHMSHELRTPLNHINGFAEMMANEVYGPLGNPRYKEYAESIAQSGLHLQDLINDILDMSKIEAGKMDLTPSSIDPGEPVDAAVRLMRRRAADRQISLIFDPDDDLPVIRGDHRAIKQMTLNLLANAIQFTDPGGEVRVNVFVKDAWVVIEITDTGIGISPGDVPRLMQPFEQGTHDGHVSRGAGLGLSLTKSYAEMHGGHLTILSEVGKGTTVSIFLPRDPSSAPVPA